MSNVHRPRPPYTDLIDIEQMAHVKFFSEFHGVTLVVAAELIRACHGNRSAADEAAAALKSHFKQSIEIVSKTP
jgi:hypothetical protein